MSRARPRRILAQYKLSDCYLPDCAFPERTPMISHPRSQQGPFQEHSYPDSHAISQHPYHTHSHSHSSGSTLSVSPMTPISQNLPQYTSYTVTTDISPNPDPVLQRRPSIGSHNTLSAELVVEKSAPRKRGLTGTLPTSVGEHTMHLRSFLFKLHFQWPLLHSRHATLSNPFITTTTSSASDGPLRHRVLPIIFSFPSSSTLVLVPKARLSVSFLSITNPIGRESLSFRSVR